MLSQERAREFPDWVRRLLRMPEFKIKASRMGKVIRLDEDSIKYYESNQQVQSLAWPD